MKYKAFIFPYNDKKKHLSDYNTGDTGLYKDKKEAKSDLENGIRELYDLQEKLYASDTYSVLIVLQAMDAAGKDGIIKHVMTGLNPQGTRVVSFKNPSEEELDHDFLWRCNTHLPRKGEIGIFNRSYYEEVLVVKVHQNLLLKQKLPGLSENTDKSLFWKERYEDINNFEKHLIRNGTLVLKFFLNLSAAEQKKRLLDRINDPSKNWKFSANDLNERKFWNDYMSAFEEMLRNTSTKSAPWYVVPADNKWFTRTAVCDIICCRMESLGLDFPKLNKEQKEIIRKAGIELTHEDF